MCYTKQLRFFTMALLTMVLGLAGCSGENGINGVDLDPAVVDDLQSQLDDLAAGVGAESCVICHGDDGSIALSGAGHQADYDQYYQDQIINVTDITYSGAGGNDTVTFKMTKKDEAGDPQFFDCRDATTNPEPDQSDSLNIYYTQYVDATRSFELPSRASIKGTLSYDAVTNICTSVKAQSALGVLPGPGYIAVYGRDETLSSNSAKHIANPKYPFATIKEIGAFTASDGVNPGDYVSNANAEACERCHTEPFLKHAYIYGEVSITGDNNDGNDFYVCKVCHLDNGNGGHQDWQLLADDEARYAALDALAKACPDKTCDSIKENMTTDELAKYAYKTRLMNDVHMSHSMEFGFPQSMKNCNTCHAGKLDNVLTEENYTAETCISCHAIDNLIAKMTASDVGAIFHENYIVDTATLKGAPCSECHKDDDTGLGPKFSRIHNGYDEEIYADAAGTKYSDAFVVSVDDTTSFDAATNKLTVKFHADEVIDVAGLAVTDIEPTVIIGLYGYNTKHYLIGPHSRDFDDNGDGVVGERNVDSTNLEYTVGDEHPRFTTVSAAAGSWVVTADLSAWADKIADGTIKRAEIGVMPVLDDANGDEVAMNAPSRTFDLGGNAFDDAYFPDVINVIPGIRNAGTAEEEAYTGCNTCHDALATSFHSGKRGGNIKICKMCHVPSSGGSHLEMQSRSIDSYVHAVHSFQVFDIGDIDESDPVEALEHQHKIKSEFPKFGIMNCEACHNPGMYGVPDQSKSLPGVLSGSDEVADRNIGTVPSVVTGPAARACGACHRAQMINADDAGKLAAFNEHTKVFGYRVEDGDGVWEAVVEKIMSLF